MKQILIDLLDGRTTHKEALAAMADKQKVEGFHVVASELDDIVDLLRGILPKPKLYAFEDTDGVELSAFALEDDERDMNCIQVIEARKGATASATRSILRNVLALAGIEVVME